MKTGSFTRKASIILGIVSVLALEGWHSSAATGDSPEQVTIIRVRLHNKYGAGTIEIDPATESHVEGRSTLYDVETGAEMATFEHYDVLSRDGDTFRLAVSIAVSCSGVYKPPLYKTMIDISVTNRFRAIAFKDVVFRASVVRRPPMKDLMKDPETLKAILRQDVQDDKVDDKELGVREQVITK